jgi:hypothetical protein
LINKSNENIDLLFDGRDKFFKVVYKENFTKIVFQMSIYSWNKFSLRYDSHHGISFWLNNRFVSQSAGLLNDLCLKIFFGANDYPGFRNSDMVSMMVKNLSVEERGTVKYFWPLNELEGNVAIDSCHNKKATVLNPIWVRPQHEKWESVKSLTVTGNPSIAFDPVSEELYIVNNDFLYTYNVATKQVNSIDLKRVKKILPTGNQSVFYPAEKKLFNFYTDDKYVSSYNFETRQWKPDLSDDQKLTGFWHVNKFISAKDSSLYIMNGYGYNKYKNLIQRYHLYHHTWDTVKISGNYFPPRYLSALGQNTTGDTVYLLGGYGSRKGDQMLSPGYYYDFYVFDVRNKIIKRRFILKEPATDFVFANSLVINSAEKSYYALIYPKDRYDTKLQLIEGSLTEPSYQLLGNEIPYRFNDAQSFADLFYCPESQLLMAVTISHKDDQTASLNIYTIATPPNPLMTQAVSNRGRYYWYFILLLAVALVIVALFILKKRYRLYWHKKRDRFNWLSHDMDKGEPVIPGINPEPDNIIEKGLVELKEPDKTIVIMDPESQARGIVENEITIAPETQIYQQLLPQKSSVFLFGNFEIFDKDGNDITHLFTPLLKELFLLILIYTIKFEKGISLQKLNETLWNKKDIKNAKNNRAVNIGKLKDILGKIGDCTLKKDAGLWHFVFDSKEVYVDFEQYIYISSKRPEKDPVLMDQLLTIVRRGTFLHQADYEWLDDIKSDVSNNLLEILQNFSESLSIADNAELLIQIANCTFSFDELNENALILKCKSLVFLGRYAIAKNIFEKFSEKYKDIYGEEYKSTFGDIIA